MGYLINKFAKVTQTLPALLGLTLMTGVAGGFGAYDLMTEDPDNIAGTQRDTIVQAFEGEMNTLEEMKLSYDEAKAKSSTSFILGDDAPIIPVIQKLKEKKAAIDKKADRLEREIFLAPAISETNFLTLAEKYNALFTKGEHKIETRTAAYLHDAQDALKDSWLRQEIEDLPIVDTEKEAKSIKADFIANRNQMANYIQSEMVDLKIEENKASGGNEDGKSILTGTASLVSLLLGTGLAASLSGSRTLTRISKEKTPSSPLENWRKKKQIEPRRIN